MIVIYSFPLLHSKNLLNGSCSINVKSLLYGACFSSTMIKTTIITITTTEIVTIISNKAIFTKNTPNKNHKTIIETSTTITTTTNRTKVVIIVAIIVVIIAQNFATLLLLITL